jgi:hypothetical protein
MNKIVEDSFECPKKYKTLVYICEKLSLMDRYNRRRICSFIDGFNRITLGLHTMTDISMFNYTKKCIREDYKRRLNELDNQGYDEVFLSYLRNFIYTKLKNTNFINKNEFLITLKAIKTSMYDKNLDKNNIHAQLMKCNYITNRRESDAMITVLTNKGFTFLKRNL